MEGFAVADRIAAINRGQLEQIGTPQQLYLTPANEFVASLLGDPAMNIMDGTLIRTGDDLRILLTGQFSFPLNGEHRQIVERANLDQRIRLGVRPTDVRLSKEMSPETPIPARVYVAELVGRKQLITFSLEGQFFKAKGDFDIDTSVDAGMAFGFALEKVHLFDPTTTRRLV